MFTLSSLWILLIGIIPFIIAVFNKKSPFPKAKIWKMLKWNSVIGVGYWVLGSLPFIGSLFGLGWIFLLGWALFPNWILFKWLN